MDKSFPNLMKTINSQIQVAQKLQTQEEEKKKKQSNINHDQIA